MWKAPPSKVDAYQNYLLLKRFLGRYRVHLPSKIGDDVMNDEEIPCPDRFQPIAWVSKHPYYSCRRGKGRWGKRSQRTLSADEELVENVMDKLLYDLHYVESCYEQADHLTDEQRSTLTRLLEIR